MTEKQKVTEKRIAVATQISFGVLSRESRNESKGSGVKLQNVMENSEFFVFRFLIFLIQQLRLEIRNAMEVVWISARRRSWTE